MKTDKNFPYDPISSINPHNKVTVSGREFMKSQRDDKRMKSGDLKILLWV